jgi:hypothetical protein
MMKMLFLKRNLFPANFEYSDIFQLTVSGFIHCSITPVPYNSDKKYVEKGAEIPMHSKNTYLLSIKAISPARLQKLNRQDEPRRIL